jgi:hypothetical protein
MNIAAELDESCVTRAKPATHKVGAQQQAAVTGSGVGAVVWGWV